MLPIIDWIIKINFCEIYIIYNIKNLYNIKNNVFLHTKTTSIFFNRGGVYFNIWPRVKLYKS